MSKRIVTSINAVTVNKFTDEAFAEKMELEGIDGEDELKLRLQRSMRKTLAQFFDESVQELTVECRIEDDESNDPYKGVFTDLSDGGGCSETTEYMNEVRDA